MGKAQPHEVPRANGPAHVWARPKALEAIDIRFLSSKTKTSGRQTDPCRDGPAAGKLSQGVGLNLSSFHFQSHPSSHWLEVILPTTYSRSSMAPSHLAAGCRRSHFPPRTATGEQGRYCSTQQAAAQCSHSSLNPGTVGVASPEAMTNLQCSNQYSNVEGCMGTLEEAQAQSLVSVHGIWEMSCQIARDLDVRHHSVGRPDC